jgi:hypothetical protein
MKKVIFSCALIFITLFSFGQTVNVTEGMKQGLKTGLLDESMLADGMSNRLFDFVQDGTGKGYYSIKYVPEYNNNQLTQVNYNVQKLNNQLDVVSELLISIKNDEINTPLIPCFNRYIDKSIVSLFYALNKEENEMTCYGWLINPKDFSAVSKNIKLATYKADKNFKVCSRFFSTTDYKHMGYCFYGCDDKSSASVMLHIESFDNNLAKSNPRDISTGLTNLSVISTAVQNDGSIYILANGAKSGNLGLYVIRIYEKDVKVWPAVVPDKQIIQPSLEVLGDEVYLTGVYSNQSQNIQGVFLGWVDELQQKIKPETFDFPKDLLSKMQELDRNQATASGLDRYFDIIKVLKRDNGSIDIILSKSSMQGEEGDLDKNTRHRGGYTMNHYDIIDVNFNKTGSYAARIPRFLKYGKYDHDSYQYVSSKDYISNVGNLYFGTGKGNLYILYMDTRHNIDADENEKIHPTEAQDASICSAKITDKGKMSRQEVYKMEKDNHIVPVMNTAFDNNEMILASGNVEMKKIVTGTANSHYKYILMRIK